LLPATATDADAASFVKNPSLYSQNGYGQAGLKIIFDKYSAGEVSREGGQCFGFAEWCRKTIAAKSTGKIRYNYKITKANVKKFKGVNPGTHMRIGKYKNEWSSNDGHSICILKITDDRVYYVQSNWACNRTNKVSYGNDTIKKFVERFGYNYDYITYVNKVKSYKTTNRNPNFKVVYNANGGVGKMSSSAIKYGRSTAVKSNTFTRSGYKFDGWYIKRSMDGKWFYRKGSARGWYVKGKQPSGYSLYVLPNKGKLSKLTPAGYSATLYAKWVKGNSTDSNNNTEQNTAASTLRLTSYSGPSAAFLRGNKKNIDMAVASNYPISNLCIQVNDSNGNRVVRVETDYYGEHFSGNLSTGDASFNCSSLTPGKYTVVISATDAKKTAVLKTAAFEVKNVLLNNYRGPSSTISKGTSVYMKGNFVSNYTITAESINIYNSSGKLIQKGIYYPKSKTADLSKADIGKIYFSKLAKGTYTLKVKVSVRVNGTLYTYTKVNKTFRVV